MRSTLNARSPSSTRSAKSAASADFSISSSPSSRYTGSVALDAICFRTADGFRTGIGALRIADRGLRIADRGSRIDCGLLSLSERLEDRADDRACEFGRDALQRRRVGLKERRGVGGGPSARRFVFLTEHDGGGLPQHFVLPQVAQLDARGHRDGVARGELLRVEARRLDLNRADFAGQHRVDAGVLRKNLVLAAPDELGANLLRQEGLEVEDGRAVRERRDPYRLDVRGQKGASAREGVSAPCGDKDIEVQAKDTEDNPHLAGSLHLVNPLCPLSTGMSLSRVVSPRHARRQRQETTTLTSGPFAMTTLRIVFPAVCVCTIASASASSGGCSSPASAGAVTRARTLPLI